MISELIEQKRDWYIDISNQIWDYAETRFEEYRSAELLCKALEQEGFAVERGVGGMQTAFIASYGSGKPVVALLGEFDALSGLSQKKASSEQEAVVQGGNGHGCGHNLLGTGALAAAVTLKQIMEEQGIGGTIRYYGCPGEEGGSGKTFMAREHLFDDIDFAVSWHPMDYNSVMSMNSLANYQIYYKFKGKSSHAAASPHLGRSALDAVELMNVGVNYLREHIIQEARVHYAVTNTGGLSPNVVQPSAEVLYLIRAPHIAQAKEIFDRVSDVARGAALMTGTEVQIVFDKACSNLVPNEVLERVMHAKFEELGVPAFDEQERKLAQAVRATLSEAEIASAPNIPDGMREKELADRLNPYVNGLFLSGSTDVGDVSWIAPTVQCTTACFVIGSPPHSWQWVTLGATSIAHKGMLHAGKIMAATALEAILRPELVEQAKSELRDRLRGHAYACPIPSGVVPSARK
ncbi:amidohydrolase [Paenibacillus rigui]|uniref:Amidohydrolase n=1 Tax=Paenibacillus rigui TaxID=554312 RepID=A0A229UKT1_9BACL|nr:amidohydrolase [Paenibacillus rigui]